MQRPYPSGTNRTRKRSYRWGIVAEYLCCALLVVKGYSILAIRHRNHFGEIDIVAKKSKTLVFVEVKARKAKEAALYSVTPAKQQILAKAATIFAATHKKYSHLGLRFDVMVVTSPIRIYHLKNTWRSQ